jgi:hypothetical protein
MKKILLAALFLVALDAFAAPPKTGFEGVKKGTVCVFKIGGERWREEIVAVGAKKATIKQALYDGAAPVATSQQTFADLPLDVVRYVKVTKPVDFTLANAPDRVDDEFDFTKPFEEPAIRQETIKVGARTFECGIFKSGEMRCVRDGKKNVMVMIPCEYAIAPEYPFTIRVVYEQDKHVLFELEEIK